MIFLYTDFGWQGPYIGQVEAVLYQEAPGVKVLNLMADAPAYDAKAAAHLLAALASQIPKGAVVLGIIDPGVGSDRDAVILESDGRYYVGPDNGLFNVVACRAVETNWQRIGWRPEQLSSSFHGRDLFAPVAARLATDQQVGGEPYHPGDLNAWAEDLYEIIYIDGFGNAVTGLRAAQVSRKATLAIGRHRIGWARTFSEVPEGALFWYENSMGLVEIAANRADVAELLEIGLGTAMTIEDL